MKKFLVSLILFSLSLASYSQHEPGNNLGKSLSTMKRDFPELRYLKTDQKGDQYEDGYPEEGIATFFYFRDGIVIEECMICQSDDDFSYRWYQSLCKEFNKQWYNSLQVNKSNNKKYVFSYFSVELIYVLENGKNTALIVYEKTNRANQPGTVGPTTQRVPNMTSDNRINDIASTKKSQWYEIEYSENRNDISGMKSVGHFSATSSPVIFGSRSYDDAFHSAIKKIQKKAAKKGVRRLLITYRSGLNWDFLTVKVEAIGYR